MYTLYGNSDKYSLLYIVKNLLYYSMEEFLLYRRVSESHI